MRAQEKKSEVRVEIENLGGIDEEKLSLNGDVNLLAGPNSTNKTSALRAISAALGSDAAALKSDADEGKVELRIGDETYSRRYYRDDGTVAVGGEPYLDDASSAELFAFLLESNRTRLAVERDEDLRDIIMDPVDTEEIESRIKDLVAERDGLREEIQDIEEKRDVLADLERELAAKEDELAAKEDELADVEREIQEAEEEVSDVKERRSRLDDLIEDRSSLEGEIRSLESRIESEEESIESLEEELEKKTSELDGLDDGDAKERIREDIEDVEAEVERLQARREELDKILSELQEVVDFNSRMLDERDVSRVLDPDDGDDPSSKTEALVDDTIVCWTCGTEVDPDNVSETLDDIKELRAEKNRRVNEIQNDIEELRAEKKDLESELDRIETLEGEVSRIEDEYERRRRQIEDLRDELAAKEDELADVERKTESLEEELEEAGSETLDAHRRKKELEVEMESLEDEAEELESRIREVRDELDREPDLKEELDEVEASLDRERGRIDHLESEAVESFNDHMDEILGLLRYENLERIWIQPRDTERKEGRRKVEDRIFDLNVVREDDDGNVYEGSVENLSESEKEVVGLVFALAGYLAHEVHDDLPFMLVDSLGALDADRLDDLLDYFADYVPHIVAAVLPEVAEKLDDGHEIVETNR